MEVISLADRLSVTLEKGDRTELFLDFAKAFNTVDHEMFLCNLDHYGVRSSLLD